MSEAAATLGERLRTEREKQGLSTQKAADELHLDPWAVEALESGDYARVGPSVYVKGHVKRYADLLGLPAAEMVEALEVQPAEPLPAAKTAGLRMRTDTASSGSPWGPIVVLLVVALVVAGAMWWRPWHPRIAAQPAAVPAAAEAAASGAAVVADNAAAEAGGEAQAAAADTVPAHGAAPSASAATPAAAGPSDGGAVAGQGRARLRLSFSADSWVDVHDASGARVYFGNGRANSVKTIAGAAPLRVYLKSASGVQLEINNHVVAIGRQFVAGDAAHFEAGADGVLRRDTGTAASDGTAAPSEPAAPVEPAGSSVPAALRPRG